MTTELFHQEGREVGCGRGFGAISLLVRALIDLEVFASCSSLAHTYTATHISWPRGPFLPPVLRMCHTHPLDIPRARATTDCLAHSGTPVAGTRFAAQPLGGSPLGQPTAAQQQQQKPVGENTLFEEVSPEIQKELISIQYVAHHRVRLID